MLRNDNSLPSIFPSFFPASPAAAAAIDDDDDPAGFLGFLFLVCIPSFLMARGRLTPCSL